MGALESLYKELSVNQAKSGSMGVKDWIGSAFYQVDVTFIGGERLILIIGGCEKDEPPPTTEEAFELLNEQAEINDVTGVETIHSITRVSPLEAFVIQIGNTLRI